MRYSSSLSPLLEKNVADMISIVLVHGEIDVSIEIEELSLPEFVVEKTYERSR
jgi:hypothetical protein